MFKKILIFLLVLGFAVSANAMKIGERQGHRRGHKTVAAAQVANKININRASTQELTKVKGLGAKKADAIVAYRKDHGNFKSVDDLTKIKGIGEARLAKIKPGLMV